jgi:hypothetical protein
MGEHTRNPENPLTMPPPYWEDCGAMDQFIRSMEAVNGLLPILADEIDRIEPIIDAYHERRDSQGQGYDPDYVEFGKITDSYMDFVMAIGSYADLCVLMGAITAESLINKFCVYNLDREVAACLERLTSPEKLLIASALVGQPGVKSRAPYEAIKELTKWRNSFAHGHCVDRPSNSLHKNHLRGEPPGIEREAPVTVGNMKEMVCRFIRLHDYLGEITKNPYVVSGVHEDVEKIKGLIVEIQRFHFSALDYPYSMIEKDA